MIKALKIKVLISYREKIVFKDFIRIRKWEDYIFFCAFPTESICVKQFEKLYKQPHDKRQTYSVTIVSFLCTSFLYYSCFIYKRIILLAMLFASVHLSLKQQNSKTTKESVIWLV